MHNRRLRAKKHTQNQKLLNEYRNPNHEDTTNVTGNMASTPKTFQKFGQLPPELRHQIWQAVLPASPGINFFNVHCIPNDHEGVNSDDDPPRLYLDLRRLNINDEDEVVARYDPSVFHVRDVLSATCREAREAVAIPEGKAAMITLTRPARGLFIRAGFDLRRYMLSDRRRGGQRPPAQPTLEALEHRHVKVHIEDVLCLSIQNCSFNLPAEEEQRDDQGWTFDPWLMPGLPATIPSDRYCLEFASFRMDAVRFAADGCAESIFITTENSRQGNFHDNHSGVNAVMADALTIFGDDVNEDECLQAVVSDRFEDRYRHRTWEVWSGDHEVAADSLGVRFMLFKVSPEKNRARERYLRSATLVSPKRPATLVS